MMFIYIYTYHQYSELLIILLSFKLKYTACGFKNCKKILRRKNKVFAELTHILWCTQIHTSYIHAHTHTKYCTHAHTHYTHSTHYTHFTHYTHYIHYTQYTHYTHIPDDLSSSGCQQHQLSCFQACQERDCEDCWWRKGIGYSCDSCLVSGLFQSLSIHIGASYNRQFFICLSLHKWLTVLLHTTS